MACSLRIVTPVFRCLLVHDDKTSFICVSFSLSFPCGFLVPLVHLFGCFGYLKLICFVRYYVLGVAKYSLAKGLYDACACLLMFLCCTFHFVPVF